MSVRSDEDDSMGSETQQIPNDMQYSSVTKDKLYEPKKKGKFIRVLIVMAYVFSVSLAAIMLSLYYVFLWDPKIPTVGREGAPMALMDPGPQRNISCFHLGVPMKAEYSAPHSLPSVTAPVSSTRQPPTNSTLDRPLDT